MYETGQDHSFGIWMGQIWNWNLDGPNLKSGNNHSYYKTLPGPPETQVANNVVSFLTSTLRNIPTLAESTTNGASYENFILLIWKTIIQQQFKVVSTLLWASDMAAHVKVLTITLAALSQMFWNGTQVCFFQIEFAVNSQICWGWPIFIEIIFPLTNLEVCSIFKCT